jgi:hypothetical protein
MCCVFFVFSMWSCNLFFEFFRIAQSRREDGETGRIGDTSVFDELSDEMNSEHNKSSDSSDVSVSGI